MTKSQDSAQSVDQVKTVRYLRAFSPFTGLSNLDAITLLYTINYDTRTVAAQWAICRGDNFNKKVGREIAENAPKVYFPYTLVDTQKGLTNALFYSLGIDRYMETYKEVTTNLKKIQRAVK